MNNTTRFTSTLKSVNKGKRMKYVVFADGVEIGQRTTGRSNGFRYAIVARKNYAFLVQNTLLGVKTQNADAAKYQGYLANPAAALAKEHNAFHRNFLDEQIKNGGVAKWITGCQSEAKRLEVRLAELLTLTQDSPEFSRWTVIGFSNTGNMGGNQWNFGEQLVALVRP